MADAQMADMDEYSDIGDRFTLRAVLEERRLHFTAEGEPVAVDDDNGAPPSLEEDSEDEELNTQRGVSTPSRKGVFQRSASTGCLLRGSPSPGASPDDTMRARRRRPLLAAPLLQCCHPSPHTQSAGSLFAGRSTNSSASESSRGTGGGARGWNRQSSGGLYDEGEDWRSLSETGSSGRFSNGTVRDWGRGQTLRTVQALGRELTWLYYRTRQRQELRFGLELVDESAFPKGADFQFWRDLRPPIHVTKVDKLREGSAALGSAHPDGELHAVTYECGMDHRSEREQCKTNGSTFDCKVHGIAEVRIPASYPKQRQLVIVTWGRPQLNTRVPSAANARRAEPSVPAGLWMPIAVELGLRPGDARLANCRAESEQVGSNFCKEAKQTAMQKMLLGPHATLPQLAKVEKATMAAAAAADMHGVGGNDTAARRRKRERRLFTSAAGFVSYG